MATRTVNPSFSLNIKGILWKFKTYLQKRFIAVQDRLGWYGYQNWIRENEPVAAEIEIYKSRVLEFPHEIGFCCLLDGYRASTAYIELSLKSLAAQIYPHWQAYCLIPPSNIDPHLQSIVDRDPRIHLLKNLSEKDIFLKAGIADYPAKALSMILKEINIEEGDFLFCLNAGDTLSPILFFRMVHTLHIKNEIDLFYTDEDRFSFEKNKRHSPFFKPDWSPELLYSTNYLKSAMIRIELLKKSLAASDQETSYMGLILRCASKSRKVCHIAEILFHFLDETGEGETRVENGNYLPAIKKHLELQGFSDVEVRLTSQGLVHLTWKTDQPLVSIIIPTKDCLPYLRRAIDSIHQLTEYPQYEIVIVDNESQLAATHQYFETLGEFTNIHILRYQGRFNFSKSLNIGASQARGEILLFLNNDIQVINPDWLTELVRWAILPGVGIVGAKLLYPDGRIQHAGIILGMEGHASHVFNHLLENFTGIFGTPGWYRNYSAVTGACMAMRRDVYNEIGGFDEKYQLVFSDVAICLEAIRRGYRVVYNPFACLIHHEGRTRSRYIPVEDINTGFIQFQEIIERGDPYYNRNLSYAIRQPTFRRRGEEKPSERLKHIREYFGNYSKTNRNQSRQANS